MCKLSAVFLHAEYQEYISSDGPPTREWVITNMADSCQLGTVERVREKEALLTTAGNYANSHGRELTLVFVLMMTLN